MIPPGARAEVLATITPEELRAVAADSPALYGVMADIVLGVMFQQDAETLHSFRRSMGVDPETPVFNPAPATRELS